MAVTKIFDNPKELYAWLIANNIGASEWGIGAAKTINDLFDEISTGQCIIEENPPLRIIYVARVLIRQNNHILIELEQELENKRLRQRKLLPSEKLKPNETYQTAAVRCLQEELEIQPDCIKIVNTDPSLLIKYVTSPSYPGLKTQYTFQTLEANIEGLRETEFWTSELDLNSRKLKVRHHWIWLPENEFNLLDV